MTKLNAYDGAQLIIATYETGLVIPDQHRPSTSAANFRRPYVVNNRIADHDPWHGKTPDLDNTNPPSPTPNGS